MNYLSLNGNWEMNKKNDSTIVQASVPSTETMKLMPSKFQAMTMNMPVALKFLTKYFKAILFIFYVGDLILLQKSI